VSLPPITQTFNPAIGEYGQDYSLPVGRPIYSPVGGTIGTEDKGKADWGKRVLVFTSSATAAATGVTAFAVGHLTKFAVSAGQKIKPGDLIGYSGGAKSDPSSGDSSGPHVEPQFFGKGMKPINPVDIFKRFASWEQAIFSGGSSSNSGDWWNVIVSPKGNLSPSGSSSVPTLDPLAGVADAIGQATGAAQSTVGDLTTAATRAFWFLFAFALFMVGVFLIFFGDLEKLGERVADVAEKVAPEAAVAAA
jgi:hypothetical protein